MNNPQQLRASYFIPYLIILVCGYLNFVSCIFILGQLEGMKKTNTPKQFNFNTVDVETLVINL